ncbi:MAG: 2'-5' RNA ligase family protein [Gammaproteobacteria bacterium]
MTLMDMGQDLQKVYNDKTKFAKLETDCRKLLAQCGLTQPLKCQTVVQLGYNKEYISLELLQSDNAVKKLHAKLKTLFEDSYDVKIKSDFEFIPHVTVGKIPKGNEPGNLLKQLNASLAPVRLVWKVRQL